MISQHVLFDETIHPSLNLVPFNLTLVIPEDGPAAAEVVDEVHSTDMELVDKAQPMELELDDTSRMVDESLVTQELDGAEVAPPVSASRIKVIGPWHPTIISSAIDSQHILPYSRRPKVFLSTHNDSPRTFKQALNSSKKEV
ncbi:hypothetical protein O181_032231 [Austropuccinia psidii MF-1]|uniref:Uncharacterized protein n=1 Tax=Austropuccinia psidii MF-1 TaxID=1389203 RepID=A0A9Q3D208_9BASI|nr:hypothetical protein [Austropuccinia psidii MF-1]